MRSRSIVFEDEGLGLLRFRFPCSIQKGPEPSPDAAGEVNEPNAL